MSVAVLSILSSIAAGGASGPELDAFVTVEDAGGTHGVIGYWGAPLPAVGAIDPSPAVFAGVQIIAVYSDAGDEHTWSVGVLDPVGLPNGTQFLFGVELGNLVVSVDGPGTFAGPPVVSHNDFGTVGTTFYHWSNPGTIFDPAAWSSADAGQEREVLVSLP